MARFFHGLTRAVTLICLVFFCGMTSLAGEATGKAVGGRSRVLSSDRFSQDRIFQPPSPSVRTGLPNSAQAGRRHVRHKSYRAQVRQTGRATRNKAASKKNTSRMWFGKTCARQRAAVARTAGVGKTTTKPVKTIASRPVPKKSVKQPAAVTHATRGPIAEDAAPGMPFTPSDATQVAENVAYEFAGYTATADGSPVKLWYSHTYTVRSPYAYFGRMPVGGREVHVWMETAGSPLASVVTESAQDPLPDVAQMMERFPDGGLGVVIAGWDDFAPPTEPAVDVVEFTEPGQ